MGRIVHVGRYVKLNTEAGVSGSVRYRSRSRVFVYQFVIPALMGEDATPPLSLRTALKDCLVYKLLLHLIYIFYLTQVNRIHLTLFITYAPAHTDQTNPT